MCIRDSYQDGIDLPLERFYDMLAAADKLPTTSQPSPELFLSQLCIRDSYNDPLAYAELILTGDPELYLKAVTEKIPQD